MKEEERIKALEKEVEQLKAMMTNRGMTNNWSRLSNKINTELFSTFNSKGFTPQIAQCKSSISNLVGKSFCKNTVLALSEDESKEAEIFVDYILDFMKTNRKKYSLEDPVRGYERDTN